MAAGSDNTGFWIDCNSLPCSEEEQLLPSHSQMMEQPRTTSSLSASEWPLKRYGRFMHGGVGAGSGSWKVLESNKESGFLVLTIVVSGHFFISRGKEVLEGFSLIDASEWLKVVRNADSMLFGSKTENKQRMFRVQFMGDSTSQAQEHCHTCVQKLGDYVPVQVINSARQEPPQSRSLFPDDETQIPNAEPNITVQHNVENHSITEGGISVGELAQYMLTSSGERPLAYRHSGWDAEDLSHFIRLCLLDQSFPAFVGEVEKQLRKIKDD